MARNVHDVIDPAEEPEVALGVALRAVAGEVHPRETTPVGLPVALRITVDPAQHGRPGLLEDEIAPAAARHALTGAIDDVGHDPRQGERRRTRLRGCYPRQRADQDRPGLRLPPCVDDGRLLVADVAVIPQPRLGVDRLAGGAEGAEWGQ